VHPPLDPNGGSFFQTFRIPVIVAKTKKIENNKEEEVCPFLGEEVGFFMGFMLYFAITSYFTRVSLKHCHRLAIAPRTDVSPRDRWPAIS